MTARVPDAYVAAGSNVRPRESLSKALALLAREFPGLRASPAYSNPAVGFEGDDFINLVVAFPAPGTTEALLDTLKGVERACGREPGAPKWGPRTLDLDLLLHGERVGRVVSTPIANAFDTFEFSGTVEMSLSFDPDIAIDSNPCNNDANAANNTFSIDSAGVQAFLAGTARSRTFRRT